MQKKLTWQGYMSVAIMLFGLFFGAGNLIFPVHLGQMAGSNFSPFIWDRWRAATLDRLWWGC